MHETVRPETTRLIKRILQRKIVQPALAINYFSEHYSTQRSATPESFDADVEQQIKNQFCALNELTLGSSVIAQSSPKNQQLNRWWGEAMEN